MHSSRVGSGQMMFGGSAGECADADRHGTESGAAASAVVNVVCMAIGLIVIEMIRFHTKRTGRLSMLPASV